MGFFSKMFGSYSDRELKSIYPIVDKIEAMADEYKAMSDAELQAKTPEFKTRLQSGETLDDILPEAFATVREASRRVLGLYPYRVQLVGGVVLHQGRIAEMKTGEGKTLVATLPAYLNALTGNGVHIVTVNDYLAKRDSEWMGKIHRFLGLTVGLIVHDLTSEERRKAYAADITYGTNNEMGFDYLRDNMAIYASELVQRGHAFAIVDEVDSILIDEARAQKEKQRYDGDKFYPPTTCSVKSLTQAANQCDYAEQRRRADRNPSEIVGNRLRNRKQRSYKHDLRTSFAAPARFQYMSKHLKREAGRFVSAFYLLKLSFRETISERTRFPFSSVHFL